MITLRASARLRQKNFTSNGSERIVYGGARVTIVGLKFSSVAAPVSQVVFNFGLHGTRVETTNNGQVTVVGTGVAYLSADAQHFVQCFADVCEPIKVNVGSQLGPRRAGRHRNSRRPAYGRHHLRADGRGVRR